MPADDAEEEASVRQCANANIQRIIIKNGTLFPGSILWILKLCRYLSDHG